MITSSFKDLLAIEEIKEMRLLLVVTQVNYPGPLPCMDLIPQGPAYIAGTLKAHGHTVVGVSTNYDISGDPAPVVLKRKLSNAIKKEKPEAILVGGMAAEYLFLRDAINICRRAAPDIPIICGGSIMTNDKTAFELLRPDFCIMDEGEVSIIQLLHHLKAGLSMKGVLGVGYWENGAALYNELRPAMADYDAIPYPDYEPLDIRNYLELCNQADNYFHVRTRKKPRMLPISSGRSCPFKCTFCQYSTLAGSRRIYRGRSMENVVKEAAYFHEIYHFNILKIYDDLFSVKEERILEFCHHIREVGLDVDWNASMRVGDVTPKLLKEMKSAGCIHIGFGFESADDGVLRSMNKRITRKDIEKAMALTEDAGIGIQGNFIYGDPAETPESISSTRKLYKRRGVDHIVHNDYIMPYPGSPIFDYCLENGVIADKKTYYETIHLRPRYNMTKMPHAQFDRLIGAMVGEKLLGMKFVVSPSFSIASRDGFEHKHFDDRTLLQVDAVCPHCDEKVEYVFPRKLPDIRDGLEVGVVEPIRFYCHCCHKRFLISMLPVFGVEDSFLGFVKQLNMLAEQKRDLVIAPVPRRLDIEILRAYGLQFDALKIRSFLSFHNQDCEELEFLGWKVENLSINSIQRNMGAEFAVLPGIRKEKITATLRQAGIQSEHIHAMKWSRDGAISLVH